MMNERKLLKVSDLHRVPKRCMCGNLELDLKYGGQDPDGNYVYALYCDKCGATPMTEVERLYLGEPTKTWSFIWTTFDKVVDTWNAMIDQDIIDTYGCTTEELDEENKR